MGEPIDGSLLVKLVRELGFEPEVRDGADVRLQNCPFNALVEEHRPVSCGANLALLSSLATALHEAGFVARREETVGYCCVSLGKDLSREVRQT